MSNNNKVYHNTTHLEGEELSEVTERAQTQKNIIKEIFLTDPEPKTPFDVSVMVIKRGYKWPITSIRARMNALTQDGILIMSAAADKIGEYGAKNHTWRLFNAETV